VKYSDVDENGIVHMMLCRVIMGNVEIVHPGSKQHRPSSDYFDSGVDDLKNPQHYIVWDMNLNRHIYSEFVVTIKMPSITKDSLVTQEDCQNSSDVSLVVNSPDCLSEVRCFTWGVNKIVLLHYSLLLLSYKQVPLLEQQERAVIQIV